MNVISDLRIGFQQMGKDIFEYFKNEIFKKQPIKGKHSKLLSQ